MFRPVILNTLLSLLVFSSLAHADLAQDRGAIRGMQGCFQVTFHFSETWAQPGYPIHSPNYDATATEWVTLDQDGGKEISLQHILVTGDGVVKHWRQEWAYQPTSLFDFKGDGVWARRELVAQDIQGQWLQKVYQVDGGPQYECVAGWNHGLNNSFWECTAWSPLPRREFSVRTDYNVIARTNRHTVVPMLGWLQDENNSKLKVDTPDSILIAKEKGLNSYRIVDDKECDSAKKYWEENKTVWTLIHQTWQEIYAANNQIHILSAVAGQPLWQTLFDYESKAVTANPPLTPEAIKKGATEIISMYLVH